MTIPRPALTWSQDVGQAGWIGLADWASGVGSVIPAGFEAYARLLHPLPNLAGPVRWRDVAAWSGLPLEPGTQYVQIAAPERPPETRSPARGSVPHEGTLSSDTARLADLLAARGGAAEAWFCFWEGWGDWTTGSSATLTFRRSGRLRRALTRLIPPPLRSDARMPRRYRQPGTRRRLLPWPARPATYRWATYSGPQSAPVSSGLIPQEVLDGPRVELPHRSYLLAHGPVDAATALLDETDQSPNLWWAADRSWFVATEIDLPWTYVGGSRELIDAVLADPGLEAQPCTLDEPITSRFPAWIEAAADRILAELPRGGQQVLAPGWPGIDISLSFPRLGQRGELKVMRGGGWSGSILTGIVDREALRRDLVRLIGDAVTEF